MGKKIRALSGLFISFPIPPIFHYSIMPDTLCHVFATDIKHFILPRLGFVAPVETSWK
jgi:hypothetical protein